MGFEPTTPGLKVRSSTAELQALGSMLAGSGPPDNACGGQTRCQVRGPRHEPHIDSLCRRLDVYALFMRVNSPLNCRR